MQSAGINRGALYTHYSSLGELAFALLADGYREIADVHLAARAGRGRGAPAQDRRPLCRPSGALRRRRVPIALVRACAAQAVADLMEELYRIAPPEGVSTSLGARYTAEATTGLLHAWVTGGVDAET